MWDLLFRFGFRFAFGLLRFGSFLRFRLDFLWVGVDVDDGAFFKEDEIGISDVFATYDLTVCEDEVIFVQSTESTDVDYALVRLNNDLFSVE